MYELTETETAQVGGGFGPLSPMVVIGLDLAFNAAIISFASYAAGVYYHMPPKPR